MVFFSFQTTKIVNESHILLCFEFQGKVIVLIIDFVHKDREILT